MSAAQRSIGQRLARARTAEAKSATAQEWAAGWMGEQTAMLAELHRAVSRDDHQYVRMLSDGLQVLSGKRFAALPRVLDALLLHEDGT